MRLVGERVALRAARAADIPELRKVLADNADHLRPWTPAASSGQDPLSLVEMTRSITRYRRAWRDDRAYAFLIETAGETEPRIVGRIVLSEIVRGPFENAYLGYWIDRNRQRGGLMTEAVELTVRFAFESIGLHRVQAAVIPRNVASRRVLEKVGFREEGLAERYLRIAGSWQDHVLYALTREEREGPETGR